MSARESAVTDALWIEGGHTGATPKAVYRKTARAALKALDSVTFSQARLEAAARELHGQGHGPEPEKPWADKGCELCRARAGLLAGIFREES